MRCKYIGSLILLSLTLPGPSQEHGSNREAGNFTDSRDQQTYKWVKIGDQIWFGQNLNYETTTGSSCYNNDTTYCNIYGRLYDWKSATKACPEGWRLPSDVEWTKLHDFLGEQAGDMLKEAGTVHWLPPNNGATAGFSGFNALPGGSRGNQGLASETNYADVGKYAMFWSASDDSRVKVWTWFLSYSDDEFHRFENYKNWGYSVRCIKDH